MDFDIHQLDGVDPGSDKAEQSFEKYQDALIGRFVDSPEGRAHARINPGVGSWAADLMYYGWSYAGVTLPQMTVKDVEEIVTELFPRKISLSFPEDAESAIPELIVFWEFLRREYKLYQAESVLRFLQKIQPRFKGMMNDPAKFGMAKSLLMMAQSAGFDITKQEDMDLFVNLYNAGLSLEQNTVEKSSPYVSDPAGTAKTTSTRNKAQRKKRKISKASRKKGRER